MDANEPSQWPPLSPREGVRYEVAEDVFGDLIGWCSEQVGLELEKSNPDAARIQELTDQARGYVAERRALHPDDLESVNAVLNKYGLLAKELRSGKGKSEDV